MADDEVLYTLGLECEGMFGPCGRPATKIGCRTQYHEKEMNVNPILCKDCAFEYNAHWDDMWNEYYSGLL